MNMNKVIYRDIMKSDYETIKELIGEAFGFSDFIKLVSSRLHFRYFI